MSKVLTLMSTSSPKLANLLCLCMCLPLLCYTLVLSFLFLGVSFGFSLTSFWGCLKLVSHALVCFIGSLKPFKMKSCKAFRLPLNQIAQNSMDKSTLFLLLILPCCVCVIFEEVVQISKRFLLALGSLWQVIGVFFKRSSFMPQVLPIPIIFWTNL
jgi:hypothetical protein